MNKINLFILFFSVFCWSGIALTKETNVAKSKLAHTKFTKTPTCLTSKCHTDIQELDMLHPPLKAKGCKICHRLGPSEVELPKGHWGVGEMDEKKINETCFICHEDIQEQQKNLEELHDPFTERTCITCHDPHGSYSDKFLKDNTVPDLCFRCHKDMKKSLAANTHPHKEIMKMKGACTACHSAHGSNLSGFLKKSQSKICLDCHSKEIKISDSRTLINLKAYLDKSPVQHKPVKDGQCTKCHEPHGGMRESFLRADLKTESYQKFDEANYALCFKCHKKELVNLEEVKDQTKFRNGDINLHYLHVQGTKRQRSCSVCHEVHAANQPALITNATTSFENISVPLKYKQTKNGGTCLTACHGAKQYDRIKEFKNPKE